MVTLSVNHNNHKYHIVCNHIFCNYTIVQIVHTTPQHILLLSNPHMRYVPNYAAKYLAHSFARLSIVTVALDRH